MEKPFKVAYIVRTKNGVLYKAIKDRRWKLKQAAEFLGIRTQQWRVLAMRYLKGMTQKQIQLSLGIHHVVRVGQIEQQALKTLHRHPHILNSLLGDENIDVNQALKGRSTIT